MQESIKIENTIRASVFCQRENVILVIKHLPCVSTCSAVSGMAGAAGPYFAFSSLASAFYVSRWWASLSHIIPVYFGITKNNRQRHLIQLHLQGHSHSFTESLPVRFPCALQTYISQMGLVGLKYPSFLRLWRACFPPDSQRGASNFIHTHTITCTHLHQVSIHLQTRSCTLSKRKQNMNDDCN